jgi:hypothetical protein
MSEQKEKGMNIYNTSVCRRGFSKMGVWFRLIQQRQCQTIKVVVNTERCKSHHLQSKSSDVDRNRITIQAEK